MNTKADAFAGSSPDPGSFRDPLSRVFVGVDTVWRGLTDEAFSDYTAVASAPFFVRALADGDVIPTALATADEVGPQLSDTWAAVLRHQRVDVLSYPYEWSFEMLRDAARLQLRLTKAALAEGFLTKDASAYNVQYVGAHPVFIDVGSFERLRKGEPWAGYRQFCQLFLNPLYVQALSDVAFQPLLRSNLDGLSPATTRALLGRRGRFQKGVFTHVRFQARTERRYGAADKEQSVRDDLKRVGFGPKVIEAMLANMYKAVDALRWAPQQSTWSEYGDRSHYTDRDLAAKEAFVTETVAGTSPGLVLDLGANDGRFSRLALQAGAGYVVAVDSDDVVIDRLYRDLRTAGERQILPLVLDLANPSPALGWRSRERPSFVERIRPDLTLCLAVVHHLALTNTIPFEQIVDFLADFGPSLVVEFPQPDDVMASRLLARKRDGLFDHYTLANWQTALQRRFEICRQIELPSGTRTLYHCSRR